MKISSTLLGEIVAHALADPRNEVCGVVARSDDGAAVKVFRAENVHHSPMKFEIAPKELLELNDACEELGELGAIYHSHVRSAPYPSQTDINFAAGWPGVEWIIVGLVAGAEPDVRSYLIEGAEVREVPVEDG
ncbi:MAG TPA: M67 family metallopeptidase [Solirubrobacteraceae bacterium]|jgi:proteasome lid subunit RPN8/RPN11